MGYKYKVGEKIIKGDYIFKIIKYADIDEFNADFHWNEKNYVVEIFEANKLIDNQLLATYNFNYNNKFKYVMNENDFLRNVFLKMNILRNSDYIH